MRGVLRHYLELDRLAQLPHLSFLTSHLFLKN